MLSYHATIRRINLVIEEVTSPFVPLYFDVGILDLVLNFLGFHRWKFTDVILGYSSSTLICSFLQWGPCVEQEDAFLSP